MKDKLLAKANIAKEKVKNNKVAFIIFSIIWILTIVITLSVYKTSLGMKSSGNDNFVGREIDVYPISKNDSINQVVRIDKDTESVAIRFATYSRKNKGTINVKVVGNTTNDIYVDETVDVTKVQDNAFMTFGINKEDEIKDKYITIKLSSTSEEGENIGVYFSHEKAFEDGKFIVNGKEDSGDLKVRFLKNDETLKKFNDIVIVSTIIGVTVIILLWLLCDKYETIFASAVLILGLVFMIVITPMSPPDEQAHYEYSFQLSNLVLGDRENYIEIDKAYQDYTNFAGHMNVSSAYEGFMEDINKPLSLKNNTEIMIGDIKDATYLLCYIPQTIGIILGRLFKVNMLRTFYLGRLFNLLFYTVCVYFAIKKAPSHKLLFGVIATMPMFLQQAASYSYDTFLNGLLLLIIAFFLDWKFSDKTISNKEIIVLFVITLFVTPLKVIYSLFVFAFLFIPFEKFGSKKKKNISLLVIFIPIIIQLVLLLTPSLVKVVDNAKELNEVSNSPIVQVTNTDSVIVQDQTEFVINPETDTRDDYSIGYAVEHISETISLFYQTIRFSIKIWFYEAIGRALSGVSIILPLTFVHILSAILIAAAFRKEEHILSIPIKAYFVFVCICIGLLAMLGMMITWTKVGDTYIQGIQGRYFSPLLFYFMTIFSNRFIKIPEKFDKYLGFAQTIMIFEVVVYVLSYTFVN